MQISQLRCFNFPKLYTSSLNKAFQQFPVNLQTIHCNMRGISICFLINLFVCLSAEGQQMQAVTIKKVIPDSSQLLLRSNVPFTGLIAERTSILYSVKTIPASHYVNSLPFFCRKELQLEKALRFPVKVRMGSVEYTDRLEGKTRSVIAY